MLYWKRIMNKAIIEKYQSIKYAEIEFGKITMITGQTDSGKSAFVRSLKGWAINQLGDDFVMAGEDFCRVTVDDVVWEKGGGKNDYTVPGQKPFQKCGKAVPELVQNHTKISEVEFGDGVKYLLNFHEQMKPLFLVQGNPADNAKIIGSISNIHVIYNGIRKAEAEAKSVKRELTDAETNIQELETQIAQQQEIYNKRKKRVEEFKEVWGKAVRIADAIEKAAGLRGRIIALENEEKGLERLLSILSGFHGYSGSIEDVISAKKKYARIKGIEKEESGIKRLIAVLSGVDIGKGICSCEEVKRAQEAYVRFVKATEAHNESIESVNMLKLEIEGIQAKLGTYEKCELCGADRNHWTVLETGNV